MEGMYKTQKLYDDKIVKKNSDGESRQMIYRGVSFVLVVQSLLECGVTRINFVNRKKHQIGLQFDTFLYLCLYFLYSHNCQQCKRTWCRLNLELGIPGPQLSTYQSR